MDTPQQPYGMHPQRSQHFPPSPPPSPPAARRRNKKTHSADPFLDLGDASIAVLTPSPPSAPSHAPEELQEHWLIRLILTPLLFTSFLLSLFLVNRSDRSRRYTSSSRTSNFFARINPEPYQDATNTTWDRGGSTMHVEPHDAISPRQAQPQKKGSWHLNKKIRKVARLEIGDAFGMQKTIIAVMVISTLGLIYGAWLGMMWAVWLVWR